MYPSVARGDRCPVFLPHPPPQSFERFDGTAADVADEYAIIWERKGPRNAGRVDPVPSSAWPDAIPPRPVRVDMADENDRSGESRDHGPGDHLDRAREHLRAGSDAADRPVQTQLDSLEAGLLEEQDGELTEGESPPKDDRIAEVAEKLEGLAEQASGEPADRLRRARDHLLRYLDRSDGSNSSR